MGACHGLENLSPDDREECVACMAKLVDCISSVWSQYDALEHETLGAVVVVLEGCGLHVVSADWGDGEEPMAYPVTPLDESRALLCVSLLLFECIVASCVSVSRACNTDLDMRACTCFTSTYVLRVR